MANSPNNKETHRFPAGMWLGLALILAAGMTHIWLEFDRGTRVASRVRGSQDQVVHTFEVIDTAQSLRAAAQDAERGQRGFLITSNNADLDIYRRGARQAPELLARLKQLTADNPEQQRRWQVLEQQLGLKLATLADTLKLRASQGPEAARNAAIANAGYESMRAVNGLIDAAIETERDLLSQRLAHGAEIEAQARQTALAGALLAFAVLLLGLAAVLLGVRSLRKAEAARHEADQRYRFFVGSVTDYAIYMLDPQGNVVEWNAGAERIKGYAAEEILGRHFSLFYTPEDREAGKPQRALDTALKEGKYEEEGWRVRKDGRRFLASILIEPLFDRNGRLAGFAKVTRDVDDQVRQRQALAQYQKMDAIGQLTGGIAHDFNNLLGVTVANAEMLIEQLAVGDPRREDAEQIKEAGQRAAALTRQLLAFSRRQVLEPRVVSIGGV
ncbi:MAG TPA: CHASE3 domain-containing protein, partial [Burkholderiales bacterium]|nr:CHASE3 domain-containing protein [Burkholderiales bacterium]